ncbi:MAG: 2-C-methyl-D-erythritol 4-phosphate cytidylyltransferase, partial [Terriglobales bacterium]
MKVIVIIPAAGLGTRMAAAGGGRNAKPAPAKQFAELGGTPVLVHTLRRFVAAPQVDEIYVALRSKETDAFQQALARDNFKKPIHVVEGGEHRQESVANALRSVKANSDDIVLVHDAVRPFVSQEIIANVIQAAGIHGAAIAGVPAVDTIKLVDRSAENALITSTVPRERAVLAQTPQGFRLGILRQAMEAAQADGFTGTDEASLVERLGPQVVVVMGSPRNLKITTPADL